MKFVVMVRGSIIRVWSGFRIWRFVFNNFFLFMIWGGRLV